MKKILAFSALAIGLTACSSIELEPAAARIITSPESAPKGCKYLGQVVGNQGDAFSGAYTSNRNLEEGAMNDLKNKAARLGANYVHLIINRAGSTSASQGHFGRDGGFISGGSQQTNVTNIGNAYRCPPEKIGLE